MDEVQRSSNKETQEKTHSTSTVACVHFSGLFTDHDPARGSVQDRFKNSWVGLGRVRRFSNLTGRVRLVFLTRFDPQEAIRLAKGPDNEAISACGRKVVIDSAKIKAIF